VTTNVERAVVDKSEVLQPDSQLTVVNGICCNSYVSCSLTLKSVYFLHLVTLHSQIQCATKIYRLSCLHLCQMCPFSCEETFAEIPDFSVYYETTRVTC